MPHIAMRIETNTNYDYIVNGVDVCPAQDPAIWNATIGSFHTFFFICLAFARYTVMSGTPQKMLEHLLETRLGGHVGPNDPFLDDFLLTHIVFMPVPVLIDELAHLFHSCVDDTTHSPTPEDREYMITCRKRVIQFVQKWVVAVRQVVFEDQITVDFIEVRLLMCMSDRWIK